jgi:hypothetical protein
MKLPPGLNLILSRPITALSALQTKAGELANFLLYIPPKDPSFFLYHEIRHSNSKLRNIFLVTQPEDAHLKIRSSLPADLSDIKLKGYRATQSNRLVIELTDERVTRYGDNVVADQVLPDSDNLSWILERAAHYHRELNRTSVEQKVVPQENGIVVEFFELNLPKELLPFGLASSMAPIGPNLCHNKLIDFVVGDEAKSYGICITNLTTMNLYVNVFFFDNTNFAIGKSQ